VLSDFWKTCEVRSKNVLKIKQCVFGNPHTLLCINSAFVLKNSLLFMLIIYTGNHTRDNRLETKPVPN